MRVLYIGGNGNISWWCVRKSIELGHKVSVITRGLTTASRRSLPDNVTKINLDIKDDTALKSLFESQEFDVVCDFICFNKEDAYLRANIIAGKVKQYIFVSSVVVYERKTSHLPFTEQTPQWNSSDYNYASGKIEAEAFFKSQANKLNLLPVTVVRPAHTYDTIVPVPIGHNCFTAPKRFLDGNPMLIPGDGTNLWTLCHSSDFANAFCGLIGNEKAIGEDFHITGDEWLNWLDISKEIMMALNIDKYKTIHVPVKQILNLKIPLTSNLSVTYLGENFRGQRMWCDIYDNSKIKKYVPNWECKVSFKEGIKHTFNWLMEDQARMRFNPELNKILNDLTLKNMDNAY